MPHIAALVASAAHIAITAASNATAADSANATDTKAARSVAWRLRKAVGLLAAEAHAPRKPHRTHCRRIRCRRRRCMSSNGCIQ
eukprot:640630-Prymnesium_polylepis.1